jgi:hypothetical protein
MPPMRSQPASPSPAPRGLPAPGSPQGPSLPLPPAQVWPALPPALRDQIRCTLLQVLQEVLRDA